MIQLIFAIFLMTGAWAAWRRNPLYSTRSTLRAAGISLLAIGGVILLIVATVNFVINRSPVVAGIALGAVIIFGTLALIFIITAVSTPKESKPAALPHSVKLVTNNRRKMYVWVKVFAILLGIFALLALVPGATRIIALTIGGMTLFLAVILMPVLYWTSRTADKSLTETELNPWVHWIYTPDQWAQWSNVQVERLSATPPGFVLQRDWHRFLFPFAIIIGGVAFFVPGGWLFKVLYLTPVCGAILAIAVLSGRGGASHAAKLHAKLMQASPEAWFGRDGIFCDGVFTQWLNVSVYLVSATIDERQPRSLMLNFERSVPNPYGPTQIIPIHQAVLIPANAEADLARLQQELTARCPKAQVAVA
jgi:hypothetical protein